MAPAIVTVRAQVNKQHPDRPKEIKDGEGTIGDERHQHEKQSDHNPNEHDVVTAWDIAAAPFCDELAERFRQLGKAGDKRVKYVIWKRRYASAKTKWAWADYHGTDPHTGHIHLSVSADPAQYNRTDSWQLVPAAPAKTPPKAAVKAAPSQHAGPWWWGRQIRVQTPPMHGADIRHVQAKMGIHQDGVYGPNTAALVKTFQHQHGLTPDGVVGEKTAEAIG